MVCKGKTSEKEAYIRRTIWSSENTTNSMRNNPEYYEKWLSVILFLIHHLSDNKRVIPKV